MYIKWAIFICMVWGWKFRKFMQSFKPYPNVLGMISCIKEHCYKWYELFIDINWILELFNVWGKTFLCIFMNEVCEDFCASLRINLWSETTMRKRHDSKFNYKIKFKWYENTFMRLIQKNIPWTFSLRFNTFWQYQ